MDEKPRYALYRWSPKRRTRYRHGEICHSCLRQGLPYIRRTMRIWADLHERDARWVRDVLRQRFELSPDAKALEGHA
jgi:hypothetical protein